MKFKMQSYPKKGRRIMKKGDIILGVILLIALFVFIPNGAADDEGLLADYFKFKEEAETYSQGEISPDYSPSFGAAGGVDDLAAYCDEQCYDEGCYAACGMKPDAAECVTVRDDPNTPEDEFYVSPGCDALIAYQECLSKCDAAWEDCWNECMSKGAISDKEMSLTVSTNKKTYSIPDEGKTELVGIKATVKFAGNLFPDARISGLIYPANKIVPDVLSFQSLGNGEYSASYSLDESSTEGLYKIEVYASKDNLQVTGLAQFDVCRILDLCINPAEITLPMGRGIQLQANAEIAGGKILQSPIGFTPEWEVTSVWIGKKRPEIKDNGVLIPTEFPGKYTISAKYGGLVAEALVSTVSPITEPCCPETIEGCEDFMNAMPIGEAISFPKGNLNEVLRLYKENIPVGPYWHKVFDILSGKYNHPAIWISEDVHHLFETIEEEITGTKELDLIEIIYNEEELTGIETEFRVPKKVIIKDSWNKTREEFFRRLKDLKTFDSSGPGKYHNLHCATHGKFWSGDAYTCGGYQSQTLSFLDSIKFNKDPQISSLLNGFDYGPIEAPFRVVHQGVVIYIKGSYWETGIVLDPWPTQFPKTYTVKEFSGLTLTIPSIIGQGFNAHYPTHDRAYMPSPKYETPVSPCPKQVSIDSPVDALITNQEGQRIGRLPDGSFVSEINLAGFLQEPKDDGTESWYFALPAGDYTLSLRGTDVGLVHVMTRYVSNFTSTYKFEISKGEKATLDLFDSNPKSPLILADGKEVLPTHYNIVEEGIVKPGNHPPVASFSIIPQNPTLEDTIVGVSASSDPDGNTLTYAWYFNGEYDEYIGNSPKWEWENPQAGEHTIKLVVEDGKGGSDEDSMKIMVIGPTPTVIPGFEIALLISAIVVALIIIKRRKHNL